MELFTENTITGFKVPLILENDTTGSRSCEMFKIVLIEQGSALIELGSKTVILSAPALLCLNEREHFRIQKTEALRIRTLYFSPSIVNLALDIHNVYLDYNSIPDTAKLDHFYFLPFTERAGGAQAAPTHLDIGPIAAGKLSDSLNQIASLLENHTEHFWPCRNRSYLLEILLVIRHCCSSQVSSSSEAPYIKSGSDSMGEVILYLNSNYARKITIEELTREFRTNRNSLNRHFRKTTGESIFEYLIRFRIKVACTLLRDTSLPVSEIMERVGFTNVSYWGRTFKKNVGMTPTDFRKQQAATSMKDCF